MSEDTTSFEQLHPTVQGQLLKIAELLRDSYDEIHSFTSVFEDIQELFSKLSEDVQNRLGRVMYGDNFKQVMIELSNQIY